MLCPVEHKGAANILHTRHQSHIQNQNGNLKEAFGTGTAAVISPIGELKYGDLIMAVNNGEIGPISQMCYDTLTGIQWGKLPDTMGWVQEIK